jgi:hypothetical protein
MSNRAAKLASAVFASMLAGTALSTASLGATPTADDCLSAPNAPVPDGSHWYYRIDRATKRHCWYIREQGERLSQIRAPSSRSAKVNGQQAETTPQRSIADARAELPARPSFEQPIRNDAPVATMRVEAPPEITEAVAGPDAQSQPSVVGSRWPDPSGVTARVSPAPVVNVAPKLASNSAPAPVSTVPPIPLAAADAPPQDQSSSTPMLLGAIAGALALAAIAASIVLKFGGAGRLRQPRVRLRQGVNWEWTDDDTIMISDQPRANLPPRQAGFERDLHRTADPSEMIAKAFAQLSRRAPS